MFSAHVLKLYVAAAAPYPFGLLPFFDGHAVAEVTVALRGPLLAAGGMPQRGSLQAPNSANRPSSLTAHRPVCEGKVECSLDI